MNLFSFLSESQQVVGGAVALFVLIFFVGRATQARKTYKHLSEFKSSLIQNLHEEEVQRRLKVYREEVERFIENLRQESVLLPSLGRVADLVGERADQIFSDELLNKNRPAVKAEQITRLAKKEARQAKIELNAVRNQLDMMLAVAPWLQDYSELTVDEILEGLRIQTSETPKTEESDSDDALEEAKIARWVPVHEWKDLSRVDRLQLALDRYSDSDRSISPWDAGIRFERFIGYLYESRGYRVEFHGALKGLEDLGVDLICSSKEEVLVVQCKRLSAQKKIPVRENTVSQIFGASRYLSLVRKWNLPVKAVIATTYELSSTAREFAQLLGVVARESIKFEKYPLIKCNIGSSGEKIYHLPFDQQYDSIVIGDVKGECYTSTIEEAESLGFRHAYRWRGREK